jgi:hypothetical protein
MENVACVQPLAPAPPTPSEANAAVITPLRDSVALRRLMEEVRCEEMTISATAGYNRLHNRHNR